MEKKHRLRNNEDFKKVYRKGKNYWNRNIVLYVTKNGFDYSRIGFSVTKKIGNSVVRNRVKRRMREICRLNFDNIKEGYDIIFIPKRNVIDIDYLELESAMLHILKLAHLKKNSGGKWWLN